jgi:DNA-binding NarL/FixJ family response regulator
MNDNLLNFPAPVPARHTVFIVDDHPLMRESLATLLDRQSDLRTCGQAGDSITAYAEIERVRPEIVIVDLALPGESGLELIKKLPTLAHPPSALVLSMHDESFFAERALRAGARGYVMKHETTDKVVEAVRRVLAGEIYVSGALANRFARTLASGRGKSSLPTIERLSDRELEIFRLLGRGIETRRVAEELRLSMKTVQAHCANIKDKLGLDNATELLREAVRWVEHENFR